MSSTKTKIENLSDPVVEVDDQTAEAVQGGWFSARAVVRGDTRCQTGAHTQDFDDPVGAGYLKY